MTINAPPIKKIFLFMLEKKIEGRCKYILTNVQSLLLNISSIDGNLSSIT